jgi:hypothetical protein
MPADPKPGPRPASAPNAGLSAVRTDRPAAMVPKEEQ